MSRVLLYFVSGRQTMGIKFEKRRDVPARAETKNQMSAFDERILKATLCGR